MDTNNLSKLYMNDTLGGAYDALHDPRLTIKQIVEATGLSRATLYNYRNYDVKQLSHVPFVNLFLIDAVYKNANNKQLYGFHKQLPF